MTPEELRKKASVSDDAIDQANLKLALMRYDAEKVSKKMEDDRSWEELVRPIIKTFWFTILGILAIAYLLLLTKGE